MTNHCAGKAKVVVAWIRQWQRRDEVLGLRKQRQDFVSGHGQHGTQQPNRCICGFIRQRALRGHGCQPSQARSANQPKQQRLCLIVLGVSDQHHCAADLARRSNERFIPRLPRRRLKRRLLGHLDCLHLRRKAQALGHLHHLLGFAFGLRSQSVIDAHHLHGQWQPQAQQPQRQNQRGRVWPSRAAHDDLFMPRKPRFGERFGDLRHTRHASQSSPQRALVRWVYCGQLCAHCR